MMVNCYFLFFCFPLCFGLVDHGQPGKLQPAFTNLLVNRSIGVDRDVTFTCAVKNLGRYRVGWVKADTKAIQAIGNTIITHNARVSVSGDFKSTFNLHIKQVAVEDAGNYMCQVNTDPMTFQTAHMAVMVPPGSDMTRTSAILPLAVASLQVVHLTHDLNPATHRLIANEFLPDLPD